MTEHGAEHAGRAPREEYGAGPDLCIAMHGEYKCEGCKGHSGPHFALGGDIEWTGEPEPRLITDGGEEVADTATRWIQNLRDMDGMRQHNSEWVCDKCGWIGAVKSRAHAHRQGVLSPCRRRRIRGLLPL